MVQLGADIAGMGTYFISSEESLASDEYKEMLVGSNFNYIATSALFTGVDANYLVPSVEKVGLTRADLNSRRDEVMINDEKARSTAWKDIWSAGKGVGATKSILPVFKMVQDLYGQYQGIVKSEEGAKPSIQKLNFGNSNVRVTQALDSTGWFNARLWCEYRACRAYLTVDLSITNR